MLMPPPNARASAPRQRSPRPSRAVRPPGSAVRPPRRSPPPGPRPRRHRVGIAAGALAVSGMSAASENAIPGDALYGMKRSDRTGPARAGRLRPEPGRLFLDFARTRLGEAQVLSGDVNGVPGRPRRHGRRHPQGVRLLTAASVHRQDEAALDLIDLFVGRSTAGRRGADGEAATGTVQGRIRTSLFADRHGRRPRRGPAFDDGLRRRDGPSPTASARSRSAARRRPDRPRDPVRPGRHRQVPRATSGPTAGRRPTPRRPASRWTRTATPRAASPPPTAPTTDHGQLITGASATGPHRSPASLGRPVGTPDNTSAT